MKKKRGRVATVYTKEKAGIVRARVKKGEFVKTVCAELGMDYRNFCRFCRMQGIKIHTKATLKDNYRRRAHGPRPKTLKIIKAIERGWSLDRIAKAFGVGTQYVRIVRSKYVKA